MTSLARSPGIGRRPWIVVGVSIGCLMLAMAVAGVVAIVENERVKNVTEEALLYDLEVEDEGDDLRVAVLDVRHHHYNILFNGPTTAEVEEFDQAYNRLTEEIGELEALQAADPTTPLPAGIRERAERYYADFRPSIWLFTEDPQSFRRASDEGLRRIQELDDAADEIDDLGEHLSEEGLSKVNDAVTTGRAILIALLAGVAVVAVILAVSAGRIFSRLHATYAREQATARELTRALQTKTDFIGDASHELRTPLTVIRGNAEVALETGSEGIRREALNELLAEVTRMSALVDDLLFLARTDAGMPPLEKELVPARWLITHLTKPAEETARQRSSCLTVEFTGHGYLEVDPRRVEQAVLILIDNAAKHAPAGTCVGLTGRTQNGELAIEVTDTGPGIPIDELPLIFDRFYQIGTRRARKKNGSGFSLSIAKTIVEAHGGKIGVESRTGDGTRMTIWFPLCSPVDSPTVSVLEGQPV